MNPIHPASIDMPDRPRIGLVVVDDGLYTHRWVASVLNSQQIQTVCVACLSPFQAVNLNPSGARGLWAVTRARLAYYGPVATLRLAWKAIVAAIRDLRFRLGFGGEPGSVTSAVRARGIEVLRPAQSDIEDRAFRARLTSLRLDLLVCAFSQMADRAFLDLPRLGCLNVHFSLLPERRGREPLFFAMLAGKEAGVSVHWMTPKLDNGPVVVQQPLATTGQRTLHQLILAACELAAQVVPLAIDRAIAGRPPRRRRHAIAPHGRLAFARRRRTIQVKGASVRVTQSGGQARNDCGQRGRVCPVRAID